ncbi:hypothetical protein SAMN04489762_2719 [Terribacillus saccharophilus]|uniref:DUF3899 domain-containing protein n=1 Tax=Terribacillus saccharophilus TaxID=361277 RepID=A0A075LFB5_9BACI|nr:hypothetical protein GZ22_00985 [Terribacillus goriensis]SEN74070.1 hypothetical protein SAMN04489762_2719 [Terribacillus saccharophilus]
MKKTLAVCLTIVSEFLLIWLIAIIFSINMMEILTLGGILVFAVIWLFSLAVRNSNNQSHAHNKGFLGFKTGDIQLFRFQVSPVIMGVLLFVLISIILTAIYYASYF